MSCECGFGLGCVCVCEPHVTFVVPPGLSPQLLEPCAKRFMGWLYVLADGCFGLAEYLAVGGATGPGARPNVGRSPEAGTDRR